MILRKFDDKTWMAKAAADEAARLIREAIAARSRARIVVATGTSQIEFLEALATAPDVAWGQVELFHLDEYIGVPADHPASFQHYVRERVLARLPVGRARLLDGMADPEEMCRRAGAAIAAAPIDVVFAGIGENGHLAFNDPPADFDTDEQFIVVDLDERCRSQQVRGGWFSSLEEVPRRAISMSIRQILKARAILCLVSGARKAEAVKLCLEGGIGPMAPASALRLHENATVFLDREAASLLQDVRLNA
ncbi:MAG: glucosamine-6-phosphate deaminase [Acidobacteriota bacterium]